MSTRNLTCTVHVMKGSADAMYLIHEDGHSVGTGEDRELADLMVAAPKMLALLKELIDIEGPQPGTAAWADKARALIAEVEQ